MSKENKNKSESLKKLLEKPSIMEAFKICGSVGGSSTSPKKVAASRKNGFAPCKNGKKRGRPFKKDSLHGNGFKSVYE